MINNIMMFNNTRIAMMDPSFSSVKSLAATMTFRKITVRENI